MRWASQIRTFFSRGASRLCCWRDADLKGLDIRTGNSGIDRNYLSILSHSLSCPPILPAVGTAGAGGEFLLHHRTCFIYGQRAAADVLAIERGYCLIGVIVVHCD